jgi:hypothetical protein
LFIDGDMIVPDNIFQKTMANLSDVELRLIRKNFEDNISIEAAGEKNGRFAYLINCIGENSYSVLTFTYKTMPHINRKIWMLFPAVSSFCTENKSLTGLPIRVARSMGIPDSATDVSYSEYTIGDLTNDEIEALKRSAGGNGNDMIKFFYCFCSFLSCKNLSAIDNEPPLKLNKKRIKSGKQPLFTYKTLVIKPTGKKQESQASQGLWDNRIHLCRGHFKKYTADKPLFGRITGRFWWQPSVRGNKEKGVVMKDYKILTAD